MKKLLAIVLTLVLALSVFTACGSSGGTTGEKETAKDETYSTGAFSVTVPGGWKAFPVQDIFADEENALDEDSLQICKGGETEFDLFSKPYVQLDYYGPGSSLMIPSKEWYDNAEDVAAISVGNYTWNGFVAESLGSKIAILWTEEGEHQYQASVYLDATSESITIEDEGLIKILGSVNP